MSAPGGPSLTPDQTSGRLFRRLNAWALLLGVLLLAGGLSLARARSARPAGAGAALDAPAPRR